MNTEIKGDTLVMTVILKSSCNETKWSDFQLINFGIIKMNRKLYFPTSNVEVYSSLTCVMKTEIKGDTPLTTIILMSACNE